ncbi:endonuclease domain-containing protein [Paenarthrobacter sp. TE4293]|uniref:endonuclease domain-containing protein n=1 Tax=Paenarthrobacter sp. TE4293 TaxID=3381695 RepID=UPI003D20A8FB
MGNPCWSETKTATSCVGCEEWKPEDEFSRTAAAADGLNYVCRACHALKRRKSVYGLDVDDYAALLVAQDGRCKLCERLPSDGTSLEVDHNHKCCPGPVSCGHCVRGLLCQTCNKGLGLLLEDADILMRAAEYVVLNDAALILLPQS